MEKEVIAKNASVEVFQVANGFLVKQPYQMARGEYQAIESSLVFQSFAGLSDWLREHFAHRDVAVKSDATKSA